jgi:hypothetical protein
MWMLTLVAALSRKFTRKSMPQIRERVVGRVIIDDEAQVPAARKELIERSFLAAGREPDDDFLYDYFYNQDLEVFELVVMIDVDGGRGGNSATPK